MMPLLLLITSYLVFVKSDMEPSIVNGSNANIVDFAFSAFLDIECKDDNGKRTSSFGCGSSILNQKITLTVAHCLSHCSLYTSIVISVGDEQRNKGAVATHHSYLVHKGFNKGTFENDIALVRLRSALRLGLKINRVSIMPKPPYEKKALIAGWGLINERLHVSPYFLQYTTQYVWNLTDCMKILKHMPKGTFCAANKDKSVYPTKGDSGAALIIRGYIQIGLVSNKRYGPNEHIIIYTDTAYFSNWIKKSAISIMCT